MDDQFLKINKIIALCDDMLSHIQHHGIVEYRNALYCEYKKRVEEFLIENRLDNKEYAPYVFLKSMYFPEIYHYTLNSNEVNMIRDVIIKIKHELFKDRFESVFISHREKDKEQVSKFIELLYAIGLPRPTYANPESIIFCSSHPACYIQNGERNLDKIKYQLNNHRHTFYILWYTDIYFQSQACLNEAGAIWAMDKPYQEILAPTFESDKIGGLLDKQPVWFRSNDKHRLNSFKEQIENMFSIHPLTQNAWELRRDDFISTL